MKQQTRLASLFIVIAAALAVGAAACSGSDHPGPAGDTSDEFAAATEPLTGAELPGTHRFHCVPLSSRECRIYYRDSGGNLHCPPDIDLCRPDGTGYLGCGAYSVTDGQLVARTPPTGKPPPGR